jgi:chromosome segregation ATPase
MKEDEERVRRLPAGKETEVAPRLAELQKQIDDVQGKLQAYRDAPREKAAEALAQLEESLAALGERRRELDAQLQAS